MRHQAIHDFMNEATEKVVEKLQEYPEQFQITATNFTEGNLMYTSFDGYHRYYYSNPYMYNGLRRFLGEINKNIKKWQKHLKI